MNTAVAYTGFHNATVVSNYRFNQVGLSWRCQTSKVHSIFFNARTKTKPVPESLLGKLLDRRCNQRRYTFCLLLISFSPRHNIDKKNFFFVHEVFFCLCVYTPYFKVLPMTFQEPFCFSCNFKQKKKCTFEEKKSGFSLAPV